VPLMYVVVAADGKVGANVARRLSHRQRVTLIEQRVIASSDIRGEFETIRCPARFFRGPDATELFDCSNAAHHDARPDIMPGSSQQRATDER